MHEYSTLYVVYLLCIIGELSINDFRRLKEVLVEIKRIDLKNKVDEFEKRVSATRRIPLRAATKQSMLVHCNLHPDVFLYN